MLYLYYDELTLYLIQSLPLKALQVGLFLKRSKMLPRYWTISAIYCYSIRSKCKECLIAKELECLPKDCKMKYSLSI